MSSQLGLSSRSRNLTVTRLCKLLLLNELMAYLLMLSEQTKEVIPYREAQTCDNGSFISQTWLFQVNFKKLLWNLFQPSRMFLESRFRIDFHCRTHWNFECTLVIIFTGAWCLCRCLFLSIWQMPKYFFTELFLHPVFNWPAHAIQFFECTDQTIGYNKLEQRCNLFVPWKFSRVNKIFTFCHRTNTRFNVLWFLPFTHYWREWKNAISKSELLRQSLAIQ